MPVPIRVLILEDHPTDAELMVLELKRAGYDPAWERVDTEAGYLEKLAPGWDVILSDYVMPQFRAPRALELLKGSGLDIPFIIVTGSISEEVAVESLKQGAFDYLLKDRLTRLGPSVTQALEQKELRIAKQKAEQQLLESELHFRTIAEKAADAIICLEEPDKIYFWNIKAEEMFGYSSAEVIGKAFYPLIVPERYHERAFLVLKEFFRTGKGPIIGKAVEFDALRKGKTEFPIELSISSMHIGGKWKAIGIVRDITERKRMEEERLKTQKLEALSLLAGRVSEEFNNIMTSILGNIELAAAEKDASGARRKLIEAEQVIFRAKSLSQQLTVFAKGGIPSKRIISVLELIEETICLSERAVDIRCDVSCGEEALHIEADQGLLSNALNNIIQNEEQALPAGSRIEIKCGTEFLNSRNVFLLKEGSYVKISIKDTGPGIPKEDLERLFDPFFKSKQRESGLGLALAYSIIKSHDGFITAESEANVGTSFYVYLPVIQPSQGGE